MRRGAGDGLHAEQADQAVLAALRQKVAAQQHRRGRSDVEVAIVELGIVRRSVVAEHLGGVGVELDGRVAPVGLAVVGAVAGGHEDVAGRGIDHRPGAAPDRRSRVSARVGIEQAGAVAAERVPHMQQLAGLRRRESPRGPGREADRRYSRR